MKIRKLTNSNNPMSYVEANFYENYIAIDWSTTVMSIARLRNNSIHPVIDRDLPARVKVIKEYVKKLSGKKIMTIEETTGAQWLYVELKDYVDKIIICDPSRNSLLKEGPKNDPKDAAELCRLLRAGLLKEVYHSNDENYKIRKLFSAYNDLVKAGVRVQNQLSAIYRSYGLKHKKDKLEISNDPYLKFIIEEKFKAIGLYEEEKARYEDIFRLLAKKNKTIRDLRAVKGIGLINAVKIYSIVIDARRFKNKYKYWGYCGLAKYKIESGGRYYGKKNTRYSRMLKEAYKTATMAALRGENDISEYYQSMLKGGIPEKLAMNIICRYIAKVTYAMMKNRTEYKPYSWRKEKVN
jgi:transposase